MRVDLSIIRKLFEEVTDESVGQEERRRLRQEVIESFKARSDRNRSWAERFSDILAAVFGSFEFVLLHVIWFGGWILWNTGYFAGLAPFDPYPFGLLTMIVSLEAIFLSSFVLLSQNRQAKVADLREDVDLNINIHTELEVTKVLKLVDAIHRHLGLSKRRDPELERMKRRLDPSRIETEVQAQILASQQPVSSTESVSPKRQSARKRSTK